MPALAGGVASVGACPGGCGCRGSAAAASVIFINDCNIVLQSLSAATVCQCDRPGAPGQIKASTWVRGHFISRGRTPVLPDWEWVESGAWSLAFYRPQNGTLKLLKTVTGLFPMPTQGLRGIGAVQAV